MQHKDSNELIELNFKNPVLELSKRMSEEHQVVKEIKDKRITDKIPSKNEKVNDIIPSKIDEENKKLKKRQKIRKALVKEFEKFKIISNPINIVFFECCCKKNKKEHVDIFNAFNQKIEKRFDFMSYLQLIHKMKILKNILLNPHQNEIISLITHKQYRLKMENNVLNFRSIKGECINEKEVIDYYSKIDQLTDYDKEILKKFFIFE